MRINSRGQVTILRKVRDRLRLLPYTEVEFIVAGDSAQISKAPPRLDGKSRGERIVRALRDLSMTTDEIIALMRGSER